MELKPGDRIYWCYIHCYGKSEWTRFKYGTYLGPSRKPGYSRVKGRCTATGAGIHGVVPGAGFRNLCG